MTSNVEYVCGALERVVGSFTFALPGHLGTLGYECAVAVAEGIQDRSYDKQTGSSQVWPENSDDPPDYYKSNKLEDYGTDKTNYRTFQMLSMASLTANVTIQDGGKTTEMNYGTGEPPRFSKSGHMEASDKEATDKQKATAAHLNGRPFFEVDQDIADQNVMPIIKEAAHEHFKDWM